MDASDGLKHWREVTPDGWILDCRTAEEWEQERWGSERWYEFGATMSALFEDMDHTVTDNGDGTYTHTFEFSVLDDPRGEVTE